MASRVGAMVTGGMIAVALPVSASPRASFDAASFLQIRTAAKHGRAREAAKQQAAIHGLSAPTTVAGLDVLSFGYVRTHTELVDGSPRFAVAGSLGPRTGAWLTFVRVEFAFYSPFDELLETRWSYAIGGRNVRVASTGDFTTAVAPSGWNGEGIFDVVSTYPPGQATRWELVSLTAETYPIDLSLALLELQDVLADRDHARVDGAISNESEAKVELASVTAQANYRGELDVNSTLVDGTPVADGCAESVGGSIPPHRRATFSVPFSLPRITSSPQPFASWEEVGLAPTSATFATGGGTGSVTVVRGCGWSASSDASWIAITAGASGTDKAGTISFSVQPNTGDARRGTITVSGMAFRVIQAGGGPCEYLASPASLVTGAGAATRSIDVSAGSDCSWSAESDGLWLTVATPTGRGPGRVTFSTAANLTPMARIARLRVGADSVVITQNPASRRIDFDGDGRLDLLWQDPGGATKAWFMDGFTLANAYPFIGWGAWNLVGSGDLSGDGHPDLVWQSADGRISTWVLNGLQSVDGHLLSPGNVADIAWKIRSVTDMDNDGLVDLVWQHADGRIAVWFMNGDRLRSGEALGPGAVADTAWTIAGSADFNADSYADLVWQHSDGHVAVWMMRGTTMLDGVLLTPARIEDPGWKIRAVGDLDGDGWPDLLWQHETSAEIAAWRMQGTAMISFEPVNAAHSLRWIVGPR